MGVNAQVFSEKKRLFGSVCCCSMHPVTLTKVTTGNLDSRVPKLYTNINVIFLKKRWPCMGGLLANAFLTISKHRHLKAVMTRVLFD